MPHTRRRSRARKNIKQAAYLNRRVRAGLCERCGAARGRYARQCDTCYPEQQLRRAVNQLGPAERPTEAQRQAAVGTFAALGRRRMKA